MRLGITRSASQLNTIQTLAASRGIDIVPLPVIEICNLPFEWPAKLSPEKVDWLFFTSSSGVVSFFEQLIQLKLKLPREVGIGVIGDKTNLSLQQYGRSANFVPTKSYGKELFEEFVQTIANGDETVIYARALLVNYDPVTIFRAKHLKYYSIICYKTMEQKIDPELVTALSPNDYILFTAPSTIMAYQLQFGIPVAKPIAIGHATASEMNSLGWSRYTIMEKADIDLVMEHLS